MVLKQFDPVSLFLLLLMWTLFKGRYTGGVLLPEHAPGSFCTCQHTQGSIFKFAQFTPGACSQTFNLLNIVEHFAGWKFCSQGWSIPMKSLVHTKDLCSQSVPLDHAPGAKSLVCISLKGMWVANQYQGRLCGLIGGIIDPSSSTLSSPISHMYFPLQVLRHSLCERKRTIHLKSRAQGELCLFPLFLLSWQTYFLLILVWIAAIL